MGWQSFDDHLPAARADGLHVEDLGDEILVYDRASDTAHCLTSTAATVWRACSEGLTMNGLLVRESIDGDTAQFALAELEEQGLLASSGLCVYQTAGGITRRQAIGRLAAAAAAPLVFSVAAPTAWATHASPRNKTPCTSGTCPAGTVACAGCGCTTNNGTSGACPTTTTATCSSSGQSCQRNCCPPGWVCRGSGVTNPDMCSHP